MWCRARVGCSQAGVKPFGGSSSNRLKILKILPCRASSGDDDGTHGTDRLEEIMTSAKKLRQQYSDLMAEASAIQGEADQSHSLREELFQMSLEELQASLGVHENSSDEDEEMGIVEEYASMVERGEEIPPPPEGMYYEDKESAESFTTRLQSGFEMFKNVVQGKMKVGHLLGDRDEHVERREGLLTDVPEEKSRFVPDIPQRAMDMYTFGERVMYILRRGYQSETFSKPLELLDSYGLLMEDVVVETRWAHIKGKDAAKRYCRGIDGAASFMKCSNLLMSYPRFAESDIEVIAEGTSDTFLYVPVPTWYTSYCMSTGKGLNPISVKEQINLGIDIPDSIFPWNETDSYRDEEIQTLETVSEYRDCLGMTGIHSDEHWVSSPDNTPHSDSPNVETVTEESNTIEELTPDDAEEILRSLFGDDFDAIAQQLPRKQTMPPHVDREYRPLFEQDNPDLIKCAMTWTFQVDLVAKKVRNITVEYRWINLGHVHEKDVFQVIAIETGEYLYMMNE